LKLLIETKSEVNKGIMQKETKSQYQVKSYLHDHKLQWSEALNKHDSTGLVLVTNNKIRELEVELGKESVHYNAETYKRLLVKTKFEEQKGIMQKETEETTSSRR